MARKSLSDKVEQVLKQQSHLTRQEAEKLVLSKRKAKYVSKDRWLVVSGGKFSPK